MTKGSRVLDKKVNETQVSKTVFSHLNAFTVPLEVRVGFDTWHAYPYVSSTGRCSASSFSFSFSLLYNAFSGVIEDKVKDDLKEMVSQRKQNNKRTGRKQLDWLVNRE